MSENSTVGIVVEDLLCNISSMTSTTLNDMQNKIRKQIREIDMKCEHIEKLKIKVKALDQMLLLHRELQDNLQKANSLRELTIKNMQREIRVCNHKIIQLEKKCESQQLLAIEKQKETEQMRTQLKHVFGYSEVPSKLETIFSDINANKSMVEEVNITIESCLLEHCVPDFVPIQSAFEYHKVHLIDVDGAYDNWEHWDLSEMSKEFVEYIFFQAYFDSNVIFTDCVTHRKKVLQGIKKNYNKELKIHLTNRYTRLDPEQDCIPINKEHKHLKYLLYKMYYSDLSKQEFMKLRDDLGDFKCNNDKIWALKLNLQQFETDYDLVWRPFEFQFGRNLLP